jgi:hypothetical protein
MPPPLAPQDAASAGSGAPRRPHALIPLGASVSRTEQPSKRWEEVGKHRRRLLETDLRRIQLTIWPFATAVAIACERPLPVATACARISASRGCRKAPSAAVSSSAATLLQMVHLGSASNAGDRPRGSDPPSDPATAHRPSCYRLDRRRERAKTASPVQGLKQTSPSRRW